MTEKWLKEGFRRGKIIEKAVEAADRIILDSSDGSEEETNYLTAEVAKKLMEKAMNPFARDLLFKDAKEC